MYRLPPLPPTPWEPLAEVESRNEMPKFRWMCLGWADWAGWLRAAESCWGGQVRRQGAGGQVGSHHQKNNDNIDILGQKVPKSHCEIEPRAWKYAFLWVQWAATIKKPMIILALLVKSCQKAIVKLNPELESMHVYGSSGQPPSNNQW